MWVFTVFYELYRYYYVKCAIIRIYNKGGKDMYTNDDNENNQFENNNSFIMPPIEEEIVNNSDNDNNESESIYNNEPTYQAPIEPIVPPIEEPIIQNVEEVPVENPTNDVEIPQSIYGDSASLENKTKSFLPNFDFNSYSEESVKPQSTIDSLMTNNSTDLYKSGPRVYAVEKQKNNLPVVLVLTFIVLLVAGYFVYTFMDTATKKMVCESNQGTISITYNKTTIVGYRSDNITYDIYEQRTYADEVGIKQYLDEFEEWFKVNTNGSCKR